MNSAWSTPEWEAATTALEKLQNEKDGKSSGSSDKSAVKSTSSAGASTTTAAVASPSTMSYDAGFYSQYYAAAYGHPYAPYGMYGYGPYNPYGPYGYMSFAGPSPQQMQPPPPPPPSTKNDSKVETSKESLQAQAATITAVTTNAGAASSIASFTETVKQDTTSAASTVQTAWPKTSSADNTGAGYGYPANAWNVGMASSAPGPWAQFQQSPGARPKSAGAAGFQGGQTAASAGSGLWQQTRQRGRFTAGLSRPSRPSASSAMPSLRWSSNSPRNSQFDGSFWQPASKQSSEPYSPFDPTESEDYDAQSGSSESFQGVVPAPGAGGFRFRMPNRGACRPMQWRQQSPRPRLGPDMQSVPRGSLQQSPNWRFGQYPGQQRTPQPDQGNAGARPNRPIGMVRPHMQNAMPRPRVPWGASPRAQQMPNPVSSPSEPQQSRWDQEETVPATAASNAHTAGPQSAPSSLTAASADEWPDSLKEFVHRCFSSVKDDRGKDKMEAKLKEILTAAFNDGTALTRDWDHVSVPDVRTSPPSFPSLGSPLAADRYGRPSSNLRSPRSFRFAGSPRGRRGAVGSSGRSSQGWSPPGFRRRSRSRSRSRRSRSRSSSRSSSSSRRSSRQRRRRHRRHRDSRYCDDNVSKLASLMTFDCDHEYKGHLVDMRKYCMHVVYMRNFNNFLTVDKFVSFVCEIVMLIINCLSER